MISDLSRIPLLFQTIYYLKTTQIYYRLWYTIRNKYRKLYNFTYPLSLVSHANAIELFPTIASDFIYKNNTLTFLNLSQSFDDQIDWNFSKYGKLWTYNLTYFDYLHQRDMTKEIGLVLINDFIDQAATIREGLMPFPISLRGINWIKFLVKNQIYDQKINDSLNAQYLILMDNVEYHILGNHLLENAFSLLFGAYYFQDEKLYKKATEILQDELEEQILDDGAHFELSPMYHQIMLFRVLDCINLVQNNNWKNQELLTLLISKAEIMLGWLNTITFGNGDIPLLNDSANKIAPTTQELNHYARTLALSTKQITLSDSGYRKMKFNQYEYIMDVGNIGPDYIPGHAHSDTFNFVLYVKGSPCIVDTGVSTYEANRRRIRERSASSHNTVVIDNVNQSEVWDSFRVARRAKIVDLHENECSFEATHDGYKRIGALHTRKFTLNDRRIYIEDFIHGKREHQAVVAYLHFYPGLRPMIKDNAIIMDQIEIILHSADKIEIEEYLYAPEFNKLIDAKRARISFQNNLTMEIKI